jgi:uncharacterized membrane protein
MAAEREADAGESLLLERMLFFSDAVFAIVLTLMALDLHLPEGTDDAHLLTGIEADRGPLISFAVSFALVGLFWIVHVVTLRTLARFDWLIAAANVVFLFAVTLTPFTAGMVGRLGRHGEAWRLYCATIIVASLAMCALIAVSHRDEAKLLDREHHGQLWVRLTRAAIPGIAFAIGLALSFAGLRYLASLCWVLVPTLWLATTLARPQTPRSPA